MPSDVCSIRFCRTLFYFIIAIITIFYKFIYSLIALFLFQLARHCAGVAERQNRYTKLHGEWAGGEVGREAATRKNDNWF